MKTMAPNETPSLFPRRVLFQF